ncbi:MULTISPECIES: albusnodin/ikarugamycin family macrolactam cyclase [Streptomyces]|uniref:albusnodin/ikarugamycin family macrolactam cyclase n=1 Tax=Streptomyces TaxID=1883 RepID=UPI002248C9EF|nr:albusnodin/ikarugamycin family macrolactam cyclase [Streptomyces sp. JHD 1]MCX2968005.1 albusnodin/ikarugamycin family macrolactam cyclase [Streptomyces sp. JHD 1]
MRWFGGALAPSHPAPSPVGARVLWRKPDAWSVGTTVRQAESDGGRRLAVFGPCGATDTELQRLAGCTDLREFDTAATAWAGSYALALDDGAGSFTLWADPAGSCPLYVAASAGIPVWASSSLALASLLGSRPDTVWLAAHLADPTAWTPGRSAWTGIAQVKPGHRWTAPRDGTPFSSLYWRPGSSAWSEAVNRLRLDLSDGVLIRVTGREVSSDLSGGLDSSTLAAYAARRGPVVGVTFHPKGRESGGDVDHARMVARAFPSIRHRCMALGREHLPFTDLDALILTDEPAPSAVTIAQLFHQFALLAEEGASVHLTGDGGDSLFMPPPVHLADLAHSGRLLRLARDAQAWSRLYRSSPWPAIAAAWSAPDRLGSVPVPKPWLTHQATTLAKAAVSADTDTDGLGYADRHLLSEARYVGRTAATENQLAGAYGIEMHNPFTDVRVLEAVMSVPSSERWSARRYKPLLSDAVTDLLPREVVRRGSKGLFAVDHHHGLRANQTCVLELADGCLADLGLVRPAVLRSLIRRAVLGVDVPWGLIEPVLGTELWLRVSHTATERVRWEDKP